MYQTVNGTSTLYPFGTYSLASGTTTTYIMLGSTLVATADQTGTSTPVIHYSHPDHLGSTNIVTDSSGSIIQTLDYYPYGESRINVQADSSNSSKKYIGQFFDTQTSLSYLNARYYSPVRAQFTSEDPMFWSVPTFEWLADPQNQNSYSYGRDNPITLSDPSGLSISDYNRYQPNGAIYSYGSIEGTYFGVPIYSAGMSTGGSNHPYQCPGFVTRFVQSQFGTNLSGLGNGGDYANQSKYDVKMKGQVGSFTVYQNGGTTLPQENDIYAWKDASGSYGHVGIVVQVDFDKSKGSGTLWTAEQNQSKYGGLLNQRITSQTVDGVTTYTVQPKTPTSALVPSAFAHYQAPQTVSQAQPSQKSAGFVSSLVSKIMSIFKK